MSELRSLQAEWNSLVPVAHSLGIYSGVRILRSVHENVQIGRQRVASLQARIAARQPTATSTSVAALTNAQADTFGVEIELIMPAGMSHEGLAAAIRAAGVSCYAEGYNHTTGSDWKVVTDGSLGSYISGAEVVSPILSGDEGFAAMTKVMDAVRAAGCKINKKCGFHVHVGARNDSVAFFRNLAKMYRKFDGAINSVLAPSRSNNSFAMAHRIDYAALERATSVDAVTLAVGQQPGRNNVRGVSRYRKLNFCSFFQHGTVEFRQHQGSVESTKATQWVKFCLAMVAAARLNPALDGADTLDALIEMLGLDTAQAAYFNSRRTFFAARTTRRTA